MPTDRRFDWGLENGDIILAEQRAVAVYRNPWGQIVIRQENPEYVEDDSVVIVDGHNIPALIAALQAEARKPFERDTPEEARAERLADEAEETARLASKRPPYAPTAPSDKDKGPKGGGKNRPDEGAEPGKLQLEGGGNGVA